MANILDPLKSVATSIFHISTSGVSPTTTAVSEHFSTDLPATQATATATNSAPGDVSTGASQPSGTQIVGGQATPTETSNGSTNVSPTPSPPSSPSLTTSLVSTSRNPSPTSLSSSSSQSISTDVRSSSIPVASQATLSTSTVKPSVVSSSSAVSKTTTTSTPAAPSNTMSATDVHPTPDSELKAGNGPSNHTASIVVATILAVAVFITIVYLLFSYCPPIRKRWEAFRASRRKSDRDNIDMQEAPSSEGRFSKDRRSFMARNWYWNGTQKDIEAEPDRGGLGLGRVSVLREMALAETRAIPPPRAYTARQSQIGVAVA